VQEDAYRNFRDELRQEVAARVLRCMCVFAAAQPRDEREMNCFLRGGARERERKREREENVLFARDNEKTRGTADIVLARSSRKQL